MAAPVLVIDFGSQVTQLIARRVREAGVYCEIVPFNKAEAALDEFAPRGDHSVRRAGQRHRGGHPARAAEVFELGVPVLGICYGQKTMCEQLGGRVEGGHAREFGRADIEIIESCALFDGVWREGGASRSG